MSYEQLFYSATIFIYLKKYWGGRGYFSPINIAFKPCKTVHLQVNINYSTGMLRMNIRLVGFPLFELSPLVNI
mgnify:CR=1 FL=1